MILIIQKRNKIQSEVQLNSKTQLTWFKNTFFAYSPLQNTKIFVLFLITALCSALKVGVRVEYMDRGEAEGGQVTAHEFPDGLKPKVYLLYRPGHYDILYPN